MKSAPIRPLWLKLAIPFGLFVLLGSTALVLWMQADSRRAAERELEITAKGNADFMSQAGLPSSEKMAADLGRVLGIRVHFIEEGKFLPPLSAEDTRLAKTLLGAPADGKCRGVNAELEAVRLPLQEHGGDLLFLRNRPPTSAVLTRPQTLAALGAFWLVSLALAMVVGRTLVRPLQSLAQQLPRIDEPGPTTLSAAERHDEIGHLARVFLETREQLAHEKQLRQASERLALLGKMAASLAHEVQNPVAAIRLHGQLLQQSMPQQRSLDLILQETVRIEDLVNQWLFLARPQPPAVVECDLAALCRECVERLEPKAQHAGVRMQTEYSAGTCQVAADRKRLGQVFTNILTNAIQASPPGKKVLIEVKHQDSKTAVVTVTDEGSGFSQTALEHGLELFYSEKEGGMGIGLSLAAEVMRAHGGSLTIGNAPEGGARLEFKLPLIHPS